MTYHPFFTIVMLVLSIWAAFSAKTAMRHGLTYSAQAATVLVLLILAAANAVHLLGEFVIPLFHNYRADHIVTILAYVVFIWLLSKAVKAPLPKNP